MPYFFNFLGGVPTQLPDGRPVTPHLFYSGYGPVYGRHNHIILLFHSLGYSHV